MSNLQIRLLVGIVLGGAALTLLAFGFWNGIRGPRCQWIMPNNRAAFEADGQAIIQAIDDYRARTGAYPKSLSDAGISEKSPYGPWRYRLFDGEYGLSLGDYGACQWEFTFASKTRAWYYDT